MLSCRSGQIQGMHFENLMIQSKIFGSWTERCLRTFFLLKNCFSSVKRRKSETKSETKSEITGFTFLLLYYQWSVTSIPHSFLYVISRTNQNTSFNTLYDLTTSLKSLICKIIRFSKKSSPCLKFQRYTTYSQKKRLYLKSELKSFLYINCYENVTFCYSYSHFTASNIRQSVTNKNVNIVNVMKVMSARIPNIINCPISINSSLSILLTSTLRIIQLS